MTVVSPITTSYLNRIPYLTVAEMANGATGLDFTNLVPAWNNSGGAQGNAASNLAVLAELIEDASAIIDGHCCGAWGTLCATTNTESSSRLRMDRDGRFNVHTKFWPVLEVVSFSIGSMPGDVQPIPLTTANCWPEEQGFCVVMGGSALPTMTNYGPIQFGGPGTFPGYKNFATWSYVNGWPNTLLSEAAAADADEINLINLDGIYPGTELNIYDIPSDEAIVVGSDFTGANPVPLVTPLQYAHADGVSVTALPRNVKRAAIRIVGGLVKARGGGGIKLSASGGIEQVKSDLDSGKNDMAGPHKWLQPFRTYDPGS
jgi:hypothetical protein